MILKDEDERFIPHFEAVAAQECQWQSALVLSLQSCSARFILIELPLEA